MAGINDELDLITEKFRKIDRERRAYILIKQFLSVENKTEELMDGFYEWFYSRNGFEERQKVYEQVVIELWDKPLE